MHDLTHSIATPISVILSCETQQISPFFNDDTAIQINCSAFHVHQGRCNRNLIMFLQAFVSTYNLALLVCLNAVALDDGLAQE